MKIRELPLLLAISTVSLLAGCAHPAPPQPSDNRLTALAASLGKQGDTGSSIALYERAALAMPDNPDVLLALGHAHLSNDDPRAATMVFQKAYRLQEGDPKALLGLGQAALMEGKRERGNQLIAQAASSMPTLDAYNLLGISLTLNLEMDAAIAAFQRAQQFDPGNLDLQTNEALAYALSGQPAVATEKISAVRASPLAETHHTRRAVLILMLAGEDAQAVDLARELPDAERASLLERAAHIRSLPTVADQALAMSMTPAPSLATAP